jgi:protein Mpv17
LAWHSLAVGTIDRGEAINYDMVLKTGLLGIVVNGLLLRKWYTFLDRVFSPSMTDYRVIAKKILADQLVMPPAYLAIFFTYTTAVDKSTTWEEKKKELRLKFQNCFIPAYVTDCLIWPFANVTTFRYVPLSYRPAYIGVAELLWQTYLSHIQVAPKHDAHTPTPTLSKSGNNDRVPVQEAQSAV